LNIDPNEQEELAEFAAVIRTAFAGIARETDGRHEGLVWQWGHRGLWTIHAGAMLHPEPVIAGPAGEWRIARANRTGAIFALLILEGADALPAGVIVPRLEQPAPVPVSASVPVPGGLYAGGVRLPDTPPPPTSIELRPDGPRNGEQQTVLTPYGGAAVVNARTGGNFVTAVRAGTTAVVVVRPFAELPHDAPIPALLYPAATAPPSIRPPAPDGEQPGWRRASPSPRPAYREPGGNTGVRPGARFAGDVTAGRRAYVTDGDQHFAGGQLIAETRMGPGAAYAPEVVRDDRVCPPPPWAPPAEAAPATTPMDDRPNYHQPAPAPEASAPASYTPPAETSAPASYGGGGGGGGNDAPAASCD
jgi:hypothetical protein